MVVEKTGALADDHMKNMSISITKKDFSWKQLCNKFWFINILLTVITLANIVTDYMYI